MDNYKDLKVKNVALDLKAWPALNAIYGNDLFYDIPDFAIRIETGLIYNFSECRNLRNLKEIYFRNNKVHFFNASCESCNKIHLELVDVSSNGLEYISHRLIGRVTTLQDINLSDNKLNFMQQFADFEMLFTSLVKLRKINLSGNQLMFLPRNIFESNANLERIDLANNKLTTLDVSLKHLHKLKYVGLAHNNIKTLSREVMLYFNTIYENENIKFEIDLSRNTFVCECETSGFVNWMYSHFILKKLIATEMKCVLESRVVTIDYRALEKTQYLCERSSIIIVSSGLSLCYVTVIIVTVIFARRFIERKRIEEKRKDFLAKFKADRENNRYLIFIIFCQKEEALVHEVVMPVLSDCLNKLLNTEAKLIGVGYNEFRLGLPLIVETERCIRQSSAVVILHSRASGKCVRSKREVKIAYEKDKPMAIINKGFVDADLVTPILEAVIAKSPSVSIINQGNEFRFASSPIKFCEALLDDIVAERNR